MKKVIRILYVYGGIMQYGGIENYLMNYFRNFDHKSLQIDFIIHGFDEGVYDKEISNSGGTIYHVHRRNRHLLKNLREMQSIMKKGNYDIVHTHMDSANLFALYVAFKCRIPIRISHSHNTQYLTNNKFKRFALRLCKMLIPKFATNLFACSNLAGKWLYGEKDFTVIPNAVDYNKFLYNERLRKNFREQYHVEKDIVIGHIGRFDYQKNHEFLIRIFNSILKLEKNAKLVLIGTGKEEENIKKNIYEMGLSNNTIFLENRQDVNELYNMFDCFLLPSRFEGLPVVLIEAQANGLLCFVSDAITSEACIIEGHVKYISLSDAEEDWAKEIISQINNERAFSVSYNSFQKTGYEITESSKSLQQKYTEMVLTRGRNGDF